MMKVGLGYNGQIAVDVASHLIVAAELAEGATDHHELPVMAAAAQEVLEKEELATVADAGYHDRQALVQAVEAGAIPYVPEPRRGDSAKRGLFGKTDFVFEAEKNAYRCPAGQLLPETSRHQKRGMALHEYSHPEACAACPFRAQCHEGEYRRLERWEHEAIIEEIAQRVADEPHRARQRKSRVEHCFGTIMFWRGQRPVLTRGRRMVQAEWSLCALAYNLTRVMNLLSVPVLVAALQRRRRGGVTGASGGAVGTCGRAFWPHQARPRRRRRSFGARDASRTKCRGIDTPGAAAARGRDHRRGKFPHSLIVSSRGGNPLSFDVPPTFGRC